MPKITPKTKKPGRDNERVSITAKTTEVKKDDAGRSYAWWNAKDEKELCDQLISTANYLQKNQQYRVKQASIYSRVYNGKPLYNYALNSKLLDTSNQMPINKPTLNISQSCVDTLVSRITQSRPRPVFLTDGGDYKEQALSKQLNQFLAGEFYRCKAYDNGTDILRDAMIIGDGVVKVLEKNRRVWLERKLKLQLYVDKNDSYYGTPRSLIEVQLSDRELVESMFPEEKKIVGSAMKAYVDGSAESSETTTDQIMVIEGWHLPTGTEPDEDGYMAGRHTIACSSGVLLDEPWKKQFFPFANIGYSKPLVGWYSQGLIEANIGTQIEINKLLMTMSAAINLIGVPRIFIDEMSKVLETAFNNNIGTVIKFRGTKPIYEVAPCLPQEMYDHLQRLIGYYYQQTGVSAMAAASQKPQGLNSGQAIRSFDDLQTDRFASLSKRYDDFYIDLAYLMIDLAKDIAERDGKYSTIYPNKDDTREIDLPKAAILKDSYTIQCYDESSLPRDPAGRYARLSEMLAAGEIKLEEFRDLSGFPDLAESDKLANALRERLKKILYSIVEDGTYTPPDPYLLDPSNMAISMTTNFINLYAENKLEEKKMQMLRDFIVQVQALQTQATTPAPQQAPPQGQGQLPPPVSPQAQIAPTSNVQV